MWTHLSADFLCPAMRVVLLLLQGGGGTTSQREIPVTLQKKKYALLVSESERAKSTLRVCYFLIAFS